MGFCVKRWDMDLWWSDSQSTWVKEPRDGRIWRTRDAALNSINRISRYISGKFVPGRYTVDEHPNLDPHDDEPFIFVTPKIFKVTTMLEAKALLEELRDHQLRIESALHERVAMDRTKQREYVARRQDLRYALSCIIRKAKFVRNWITIHNLAEDAKPGTTAAKRVRKYGANILTEVRKAVDLFGSCLEKGLSPDDAKEVVMDQVTLELCDLYGTPQPKDGEA